MFANVKKSMKLANRIFLIFCLLIFGLSIGVSMFLTKKNINDSTQLLIQDATDKKPVDSEIKTN